MQVLRRRRSEAPPIVFDFILPAGLRQTDAWIGRSYLSNLYPMINAALFSSSYTTADSQEQQRFLAEKPTTIDEPSRQFTAEQPATYSIRIQDRLRPEWSGWFAGMEITVQRDEAGTTITKLTGSLPDQAALHGVLARIHDLGLTLIAVQMGEMVR